MSYGLEIERSIWDDKSGERIRIKPDGDSLGLLEIAYLDHQNEDCGSFKMTYEQAALVAVALRTFCDERDKEEER